MLTPGQILLNEVLPEELRDYSRVWSGDEMEKVLKEVATKYPDKYKEISHKLVQLGRHAVFDEAASVSLEDFANPIEEDRKEILEHLRKQTRKIDKLKIPDPEKRQLLEQVYGEARRGLTESTYQRALENGNTFAMQVLSKARGSQGQLASLLSTPGTYEDPQGNMIPFFIRHSHSEGLSPAEYFAGAFGARKGVFSTKFATRQAGDLGKQFNQASMRMIVTGEDCETANGIPVNTNDPDTLGSVLARPVGKYPAGTILTKEVLTDIEQDAGMDKVIARSPITCSMGSGVCSHCAGVRESGKLPGVGEHVGINAASALAERIAQGSLNCLAAGTLVRMADLSIKRIEEIKPGDKVLGADMEGNVFPSNVTHVWDQGIQMVNKYHYTVLVDGLPVPLSISCTPLHPILSSVITPGEPLEPQKTLAGVVDPALVALIPKDGVPGSERLTPLYDEFILARRDDITPIGEVQCYDISVDNKDELFVLAQGFVVKNTKHSSGQSKDDGNKVYAGFDVIKNLFQVPKEFPDSATLASLDGEVEAVTEAPQGGWYIKIGGKDHYVGQDLRVDVKPGDVVEAGDQISTGIANPREVIEYKGLGEGRRYFAERTSQAFRDSGYQMNRRNMEILTRAVLDSAIVEEPDSGSEYLPGDVVSYSALAYRYKPRDDSKLLDLKEAQGKYLEEPVMHYTIGTRITPSVTKRLEEFGFGKVVANDKEPGFKPQMFGLRAVPQKERDWMAQLGSSHLQSNLLKNTHIGAESDLSGGHPVPAIARAVNIGEAKAWKP